MIREAVYRLIGYTMAAGAWVVSILAYPWMLLYAYQQRAAWWAFEDSLDELAGRPLGRDGEREAA